jgi:diadenosine tetraphosphate (Ap4A) HIT family hydrolase
MLTKELQIEGLTSDQVQTLRNCRGLRQFTSMVGDYQQGKCPFCDPLDKKNEVLYATENWRIWKNPFPLDHTKTHLIMAPIRHKEKITSITDRDFAEAGEIFCWARDEFHIPGGCFAMRMGSPEYNAGSVLHLHANIIVPDGTGAVQVTLAKDVGKVAETTTRMLVFNKLRLGAEAMSLSAEEQELVKGRLD